MPWCKYSYVNFAGGVAGLCLVGTAVGFARPIVDEAKALGKTPADFPAASYDYFHDMDMVADGHGGLRPLDLTEDEIKGRNTWLMWCGGNEVFWDWLAGNSYGFMDLLKLVDFSPRDPWGGKRFGPAGLIIEPGTKAPDQPDQFGLYIRVAENPTAPQPRPDVYGYSSGMVGLRLFPNPQFDEPARKKWDPERYRADEAYFTNPQLIRPYRVGMTCAFCHAAPHPLNPPANVEAPQWANLSSNIGAQYFRTRAVFGNLLTPDSFVYHLLDSQPPGTIDTSLVASDNINNPNTMNGIWDVAARLDRSGLTVHRDPAYAAAYQARYGHNTFEQVSTASAYLPIVLAGAPDAHANPRPVPHVLLEGADSVGIWGALARVYLNIGTFSERWITLHNPLVGFRKQQPFRIADSEENSVYWQVNRLRVEYLAKFFLKATAPMHLKDAPGGSVYVKGEGVSWAPELAPGRKVFAEHCIICHSSKQPNGRDGMPKGPEAIPGDQLLNQLKDPGYRQWALAEVEKRDFWEDNFLSSEVRVPVTVIKTEAGRSMASNAVAGHIWEDYSSDTYKELPSVGQITYWNPFTQKDEPWTAPAGGRGYYRPPSLVSVWATAPYLHTNTVGLFNNDPSVKGRMEAFADGIHRLLTPGKTDEEAAARRWNMGPPRDFDHPINQATAERYLQDHGLIWRTPTATRLHIPARSVRGLLAGVTMGPLRFVVDHPWIPPAVLLLIALLVLLTSDGITWRRNAGYLIILVAVVAGFGANFIAGRFGDLNVGPIPAGTPVNLLANVNPEDARMPGNVRAVIKRLAALKESATPEERQQALNDVANQLLAISNSPDLVMDRGHYFGRDLTDQERNDLIELLKTF
jgi:cytochrome c5